MQHPATLLTCSICRTLQFFAVATAGGHASQSVLNVLNVLRLFRLARLIRVFRVRCDQTLYRPYTVPVKLAI